MQFSVVSVALFAGAAMATKQYTVYQTEEVTITSCGPTVTNCPASSTVTSLTSYPVVTSTDLPVTSAPAESYPAESYPAVSYPVSQPAPSSYANVSTPVYVPTSTQEGEVPSYPTSVVVPSSTQEGEVPSYPTETPAGPSSYSLSTITISTCVPTVIYSTVTVTPSEVPAPSTYVPVPAPSGTGYPVVPGNGSHPSAPSTPYPSEYPTGAASTLKGSFAVAAVAGLAAFFL